MKYRKKPVVIEAVQYDGNFRCLDIFSIDDVGKFIVGKEEDGSPYLIIPTLEGEHKCSKWDYIIRGVKGEYYPCKPDVFEMTYDRDEPTVIQAPINNYDVWDEVIDQVGSTNEMIDHIGDSNGMVKQTAVEWLEQNIWEHIEYKPATQLRVIREQFRQAKEMEKEQMFELWNGGINCTEEGGKSFDQYFNETYGGNK